MRKIAERLARHFYYEPRKVGVEFGFTELFVQGAGKFFGMAALDAGPIGFTKVRKARTVALNGAVRMFWTGNPAHALDANISLAGGRAGCAVA